jgi:multidrug efflux pump subunit AcrB
MIVTTPTWGTDFTLDWACMADRSNGPWLQISTPLEQEINGVENMLYLSSQSTGDGNLTITVTFRIGTDLNVAQMLTQNRVQDVLPRLPVDVQNLGVHVRKATPSILLGISLYSPDKSRDTLYLSNYLKVGLTPTDVFSTLQVYLGSQYVNDFNYLGRTYKVVTQADGEFRRTSLDIARLKARNTSGEMVPIGTVAQLKDDTIRFLSIGRAVRELEVAARDRPDRSDVLARLCHWFARARPTHRYSESDRFCRPRRTGCQERDPDR